MAVADDRPTPEPAQGPAPRSGREGGEEGPQREPPREATTPAPSARGDDGPNEVDEASLESFPASDPPAWIHTRGD